MFYLKVDKKTSEFVLEKTSIEIKRFPGTVVGAIELRDYINDNGGDGGCYHSSDLDFPDEFPGFENYSMDIAIGYYYEAIKAGIIEVKVEE